MRCHRFLVYYVRKQFIYLFIVFRHIKSHNIDYLAVRISKALKECSMCPFWPTEKPENPGDIGVLSATSGYPLSSWKDSNRWTDCMSSIQESTLKIKSFPVLQTTCLSGPLVSLSKAYNYFFLIRLVNLKDQNQYISWFIRLGN